MPYIATRRLLVGDNLYREVGEHVPEADQWKRPDSWTDTHIRYVATLPKNVARNPLHNKASESAPETSEPEQEAPDATAAALAEADATGVDVADVTGTGVDGRVTKHDVTEAAESATAPAKGTSV